LGEAVTYFTLTQRSTQWFAAARKRQIAAEFGAAVRCEGQEYRAFPPLSMLARLYLCDFADIVGSPSRAERLATVLAGVAALDEEWLRTGRYDEVRAALLNVRGLGTFTAHAILLRALGRPDDVPLEMAQFTNAAAASYPSDAVPTPGELRQRYGRYVGWWAYFTRTALGWRDEANAADTRSGSRSEASRSVPSRSVPSRSRRRGRCRRGRRRRRLSRRRLSRRR
jgi:DNA-3-methyladenine glycosylase II